MPKANDQSTTNRRAFLSTVAAGIAVTAVALAAVPALAFPADPVFAAIDAHVAAITELDRQIALEQANLIVDSRIISRAGARMCRCAQALVETAPTSAAGLRAWVDYIRLDAPCVQMSIRQPIDGGGWSYGSHDAVEALIAKRTAELAA